MASKRLMYSADVFGCIGDVVDAGSREEKFGDHAPHGLAKCSGHFHGVVGAGQGEVRSLAEIAAQHLAFHGGVKAVGGGNVGEVEHSGAKGAILPVNEPEAPAIVHEVGGQKIVVAEDDGQRHLCGF